MKRKATIKKIFIFAVWLIILCGMMTLLIAANKKESDHVCKAVVITIKSTGDNYYIKKNDIAASLKKYNKGNIIQESLSEINLADLEIQLEKNEWIADAEMYFDSNDLLHVIVQERLPIARVFTASGASFYIDTAAWRMPLLEKASVRVPVVTNFPDVKKLKANDSALLKDIRTILSFVSSDPFWNAQIAQIDIKANRNFELIPTIGNHIIKIGKAENLEQKFRRLLVFYQKVLSKTGFDKYSTIDVQYDGQVIAVKGAVSAIDSLQLKKNIEELMKRSQLLALEKEEEAEVKNEASVAATQPVVAVVHTPQKVKPIIVKKNSKIQIKKSNFNPNLKKTSKKSGTVVKPLVKQKTAVKKPKAVMSKRR